jgi:amino acid transporter
MPEGIAPLEEVAEAEGAGLPSHGGPHLGGRQLTLRHAVAQSLCIGPIISAGVLLGVIANPSTGAGANTALSVLAATIGCLGLGYAVSLFARRYAGAGAMYEYLVRGAAPWVGVLAGGIYFLGFMWLGGPSITSGFADVAQIALQTHLSINISWWVLMLIGAVLIQVLNYFGIRVATRAMLAFAVIALIPMLIMAFAIIIKGGAHGNTLSVFNPSTTSAGTALNGILIGVTLFVGFEAAAALGEECKHPHRDIPRAVLLTILAGGFFYVLMAYAISIGYGVHAVAKGVWANDPAYIDTMATRYVGSWLATILDFVIVLDALAVMLAMCVVVGHGLFTLARDGLVPKVFATTSRRYNTPWVGHLVMLAAVVVGIVLVHAFNYAKLFGLPNDLIAVLSLTTTVGSFMVQLIYLAIVVVGLKLVWSMRGRAGQWWRYLVVILGISVPILAYKGALIPVPTDIGKSVNYVALFYALGMVAIIVVWFLWLRVNRPELIARAASHASVAEPVQDEAPVAPAGAVVQS